MLRQRLITAIFGIPVVVLAVYFASPWPWFTIMAAVMGLLAAWEFFTITRVRQAPSLFVPGLVLAVLFVVQPHCTFEYASIILVVGGALVLLLIARLRLPTPACYVAWTWTLLGALYAGWFLSLLVAVRLAPPVEGLPELGRNLVFLAVFATFGSDTLAYFIGRAFGRHKMAPNVSPNKTWEGAVGGLLGGVIVGVVFTLDTPLRAFDSYLTGILLGLFISVAGQLGDLAESKLKRFFAVKDSGRLMPGHGGVLDRLDSMLLAGLAVWFYYFFFV